MWPLSVPSLNFVAKMLLDDCMIASCRTKRFASSLFGITMYHIVQIDRRLYSDEGTCCDSKGDLLQADKRSR